MKKNVNDLDVIRFQLIDVFDAAVKVLNNAAWDADKPKHYIIPEQYLKELNKAVKRVKE